MNLPKAARVLERRRNYLRAELAQEPRPYTGVAHHLAAEAAALDEVLAALYDTGDAPRAPGAEPVYFRDYRYGKNVRATIQRADAANKQKAAGLPAPSDPNTTRRNR